MNFGILKFGILKPTPSPQYWNQMFFRNICARHFYLIFDRPHLETNMLYNLALSWPDTNIEKCVNLLKNNSTLFLFILLVPFLKGCVAFWIATKQKSSLHLHQLSQKYCPVQFCRFVAIWKPIFATWLYTFVYDSEEERQVFHSCVNRLKNVALARRRVPFCLYFSICSRFCLFIFPSVPCCSPNPIPCWGLCWLQHNLILWIS